MTIQTRKPYFKSVFYGAVTAIGLSVLPQPVHAASYSKAYSACVERIDAELGSAPNDASTSIYNVKSSASQWNFWLNVTFKNGDEKTKHRAFCQAKTDGELLKFGLADEYWSSKNRNDEIATDL